MKTQTIQLDEHEIVIDRDVYESLWWACRDMLKAIEMNVEANGYIKHQYIADEEERLKECLK